MMEKEKHLFVEDDIIAESTDPTSDAIPCECGNNNHKAGIIVQKWGDLGGEIEDKVKIQIFEDDDIKSVVINRNKLLEKLK